MEKRKLNPKHLICEACREAIRLHHASYRKRRLLNGAKATQRTGHGGQVLHGGFLMRDATGTRRRLQALFALGYGWNAIAKRLGTNRDNVHELSSRMKGSNVIVTVRKSNWVMPETVEKVKALYDELSMIPPERNRSVAVVLTRAKRHGYIPPLCWDDEAIDDPYGLPTGMTKAQAYDWFWNAATMTERIEWVLERGLPKQQPRH